MVTKEMTNSLSLMTIAMLLLVSNIVCYYVSSLLSRISLIATFAFLVTALVIVGSEKFKKAFNNKVIIVLLCFSSMFFLLWRSLFFTAGFAENVLNSDIFLLSQEYSTTHFLVFNTSHSYFFLEPLIIYLLHNVADLSNDAITYLILVFYGALSSIFGILVFKSTQKQLIQVNKQKSILSIFPPLTAFMSISFAYSARGGGAIGFSILFTLITMWFFLSHKLKNRYDAIVLLVLLLGITFGSQDGIILISSFFLLYLLFGHKPTMVYALVPLGYLLFCATLYMQLFVTYIKTAVVGFQDFVYRTLSNKLPERIFPWGRTSGIPQSDVIVSSISNLSILILGILVVSILLFSLITKKDKKNCAKVNVKIGPFEKTWLVWLLLWLIITGITYIGASTVSETPSSDIRTIVVIFTSLILPFMFISTRLFEYIQHVPAKKILLFCLILLMTLASLSSVYASSPLSAKEPILVVEVNRIGLNGIYAVSGFLNSYFVNGGIVGDYSVLNTIGPSLSSNDYETRFLKATTMNSPFPIYHDNYVLAYCTAGTSYPSIYQTPEDYTAATNFTINNDRIFDDGVVTIAQPTNATLR